MPASNNKIILVTAIFISANLGFIPTVFAYGRKDITTYGPSVTGAGYGDAATSYCQDVTSYYYNPALLADFANGSLTASHLMLFDNTGYDFIAAGYPTNYGFFGLSASKLSSGDIELKKTINSASSVLKTNQYIFTAILSSRIEPLGIGAGLNIKYLYSDLAGYTANGVGIDVGLNKNIEGPLIMDKNTFLLFGLNLRNLIQPAMRFTYETDNYPLTVTFGTAIRIPTFMRYNSDRKVYYFDKLTSALDIEYNTDLNEISLRPGFEYSFYERYSIRAGFRDNITFGLGCRINNIQFDYAFDPKPYTNMHRASIALYLKEPQNRVKNTLYSKVSQRDIVEARKQNTERNRAIKNLFNSAKRDYANKRFLKANQKLTEIILKYPDFEKAKIYNEKIEAEMKEMSMSADAINLEELSYSKGYIRYHSEKMNEALNEWEKVLQLNPKRIEVEEYILKAREYIKDTEKQIREQKFENSVSILFNEAISDYEKRNWVYCIKKMEKIQNICKNEEFRKAYEWSDRAQIYITKAVKELSKSVQHYNPRIKSSDDTDVDGAEKKYKEGLVFYARGKIFDAIKSWEIAVRLNPSHEKAWKALEKMKDEVDTSKYK